MSKLLLPLVALALTASAQPKPDWRREFPAFHIAGNLYSVGTADLAIYPIDRRHH